MRDIFTFPDSERGHELRFHNAISACKAGRTIRMFEETVTAEGTDFLLLKLEVGPRVDEGQIAQDFAKRKRGGFPKSD